MSKKANSQLGMNAGNAAQKLRRILLFKFVKEAGLNICFRCGKSIENLDDFSIDHKIPWLHSEDPAKMFFDTDNIAYSHLKCNCQAARQPKKITPPLGMKYCYSCQQYKDETKFTPKAKPASTCKVCQAAYKRQYKQRKRTVGMV